MEESFKVGLESGRGSWRAKRRKLEKGKQGNSSSTHTRQCTVLRTGAASNKQFVFTSSDPYHCISLHLTYARLKLLEV